MQKQLALIEMDSTRTKDAAELRKKISDLEEELGWSEAERAAEIEKKSLSDQVDAYDTYENDYSKWLDIYLTDANNFADEITEVLEGSSDEIIAWLEKNNEEFKNSMSTTKKDFVEGWKDTIRSMLGETMTFWQLIPDEAKSSKGSYIKFMREHSDEYQNASQEQQQLFDLNWAQQFEDWRSANKLSKGAASYDEKDILDSTNELEHNEYYDKTYYKKRIDGFNGGGNHGYAVEYNKGGTIYSDEKLSQDEYFYETGLKSKKAAEEAAKKKLKEVINADRDEVLARMKREGYSDVMIETQKAVFKNLYNNYAERILAYREGGDVNYTGLAMVHGTPGKPEAFLDNADREMILNLINGLRYVTVSNAIPFVGAENFSGGNRQSIGDVYVTINEAEISSEEDYSVIAQRVGAEFAKELTKSGFNTSSYSF